MRIEIDFDNKIIKVCERVNFKKLYEFVKKQEDWKDYQLDTQTEIKWGYYPYVSWTTPNYTYNSPTANNPDSYFKASFDCANVGDVPTGTYQIEIN
jgi:hypothetical protein